MDNISVNELTSRMKLLLEFSPSLKNLKVIGEVSNLKKSKYLFFTLKDEFSKVSCVCFKDLELEDNTLVTVTGRVSLNKNNGFCSFIVEDIKRVSKSVIYERFLKTKEELETKGFFDKKNKINLFPSKIGIVTSKQGDALNDALKVLKLRYPLATVYVKNARVQGIMAVSEISRALKELDFKVDTILLIRGGGSFEDLNCFNSKELARIIYSLNTPIISGIGHENDFTIADFVCDKRASTPTMAAKLCSADKNELIKDIEKEIFTCKKSIKFNIEQYFFNLKSLKKDSANQVYNFINNLKASILLLKEQTSIYNHKKILSKGYTLTLRNGFKVDSVEKGDKITTVCKRGKFKSVII